MKRPGRIRHALLDLLLLLLIFGATLTLYTITP